jgi:hypothetical protein
MGTLQKVKKAISEIRQHFADNESAYDDNGRKAFLRGFILAFQKHHAQDTTVTALTLLFELSLGIDLSE